MRKIIFYVMISLVLFMPFSRLAGDIIITNDGMILNGKILKDEKPKYIDFANYHGTFNIDYKQIRKIVRTESYEADVKIIEYMGKTVNEDEIKINYEAGLEKLEEQKTGEDKEKVEIQTPEYIIFFSGFYNLYFGKIGSILPAGMDFSAGCNIPADQFHIIKSLRLHGIRCELGYFHSEESSKSITGFRISAGPQWMLPVSLGKLHFQYGISPVIGIGRYNVNGLAKSAAGVKPNAYLATGPYFRISSIVINPQVKFDYIFDGVASLYGIGFGISSGFCF